MEPHSDNFKGSMLMMTAMAGFTLNDTAMKYVTETLPLYQTIFLRGVLTVAALWLIGVAQGGLRLRLSGADTRILGWRTLGEILATVFFLTALQHMQLADLSAIMQSLPLAVTLAAAVLFRERIGWRRMLAIGIGFAGVMLIIRPGGASFGIWSVLGVFSVLSVVLRDLATRRFSREVSSVAVSFYAGVAVLVLGAVMIPFDGWQTPTLPELGGIVLASLVLIAAYLTVVMSMRVGEVAVVAPFRYTSLLWAVVLGFVVFKDLPDSWTLMGAALVIGSGVYAFYRERVLARGAR
ncbi:DMT family transporter [Phaeovulum sp.]|uniref:DMT family transporter n=1 Tax=Phaeovulum sp. TaxID=2934796 RepID=UPI002730B17C|nr:DMT family transporter [Phaeovulum sp.]MDP1669514.1 DMT family transporter [Phaeovulum sp.]MDZ4119787.1 DMT family transporter [Phaeovulum sp.]